MNILLAIALLQVAPTQAPPITVSFSEPPALAAVAVNNARLSGVAYFGATVCASAAATKIQGSAITQLAEKQAHINVIPAPMSSSIISATQNKGLASKSLAVAKWSSIVVTVGTAVLTAIKAGRKSPSANTWGEITAATSAATLGTSTFQSQVQAQFSAIQQTAQGVNANLINPATEYPVPAGGCTTNLLFFGRAMANFVPVVATYGQD